MALLWGLASRGDYFVAFAGYGVGAVGADGGDVRGLLFMGVDGGGDGVLLSVLFGGGAEQGYWVIVVVAAHCDVLLLSLF